MKAIGYLEGYATCNEINQWYHNFYSGLFNGGDVMPDTVQFLKDNFEWTLDQANKNYLISDYWLTVKGILQQLEGLSEGHHAGCPAGESFLTNNALSRVLLNKKQGITGLETPSKLSSMIDNGALFHFILANANGDMFQIEAKYKMFHEYNITTGTDDQNDDDSITSRVQKLLGSDRIGRRGKRIIGPPTHCSAIIKILPDNKDVTFAHSTWDDYQCASPRIIKHFSFPDIKKNKILNSNIELYYSSSPGLLASVDDYYHTYKENYNSQLVVIETSLDVLDDKVLASIVPTTTLSWIRSRASNQIARGGQEWANVFNMYHSGTYTNQWMVVDMMKFIPGTSPQDWFLTILEEMPGKCHWADMTMNLTVSDVIDRIM